MNLCMDLCYYLRHLFKRNKILDDDLHYNILEDEKDVITVYCPKCGHKININK